MSFRSHARSASRADRPSRARARVAWLALLDRAILVGEAAAAGDLLERMDASAFAGDVLQTTSAAFPLPFVSAEAAAAGFRQLARGFVAAAQPELRQALGRAMAEAARCCRRMLQIDDDQAAAAWRRRLAED